MEKKYIDTEIIYIYIGRRKFDIPSELIIFAI